MDNLLLTIQADHVVEWISGPFLLSDVTLPSPALLSHSCSVASHHFLLDSIVELPQKGDAEGIDILGDKYVKSTTPKMFMFEKDI